MNCASNTDYINISILLIIINYIGFIGFIIYIKNFGKEGFLTVYVAGGITGGVMEYGIVELDKLSPEKKADLLSKVAKIEAKELTFKPCSRGDFGTYVKLSNRNITVSGTFAPIPEEVVDLMLEVRSLGEGKTGILSFEREFYKQKVEKDNPIQR